MRPTRIALAGIVTLTVVSSKVLAIAPGRTGDFPSSGAWSGTTAAGKPWNLANSYVYQWNTYWNGTWYIGSAVAVAPNYLLTAGHVGATAGQSYAMIGGTKYTAVSTLTPPNDPGQSVPPDLCLVKVDKTLPGYSPLYTGPFSWGQDLFVVGYGLTGTYIAGQYYTLTAGTDGTPRWGSNKIYYTPFEETVGSFSSMIFGMSDYDTDTDYEAFFGNGDSGGGTFVKVGNQWELAGINAYVTPTSGGYCASSAIAIPQYANWISANAPAPEPASLSLSIKLTSTNTVMVYWPSPTTGWSLQQNTNLTTTNWVTPLETVKNDGTNNFIIINPLAGNRFYRLSAP